jgi:hypothetical protein
LVAHVESAALRCRIANKDDFGQIIDDITGGVVEAAGYYEDGSVKYATIPKGAEKRGEKQKVDPNKVTW